jgi:hypothetical protein
VSRRAAGLTEADEERLLRELAEDPKVSPAQRLRALEVLERKRARREGASGAVDEEVPPDPMADLDELEEQRQRRRRRASAR